MTTNFVNVFRHFGPNAEKVLLGKLGLKFGKEYFFEYDEIQNTDRSSLHLLPCEQQRKQKFIPRKDE